LRTLQSKALNSTSETTIEARMGDLAAENKKVAKRVRDVIKKEQEKMEGNNVKKTQVVSL
jgi:membrane protease subunit (stomatin/prohibitin family)